MSRIYITGMGVISAIGRDLAQNRNSLIEGKCGISTFELLPSKYANRIPCGEIKISNEQLKQQLRSSEPGTTRTGLLALHAFDEAIQDGQLTTSDIQSLETAFILGTTVGGICLTDELYKDAQQNEQASEYINSYDSAAIAMFIQKRYKLIGIQNTINTACSSSANAIMYGARLIKNGLARRAIVGGVDSLAKFTINGFNALHILSNEKCTPFDEGRKGLNLGEGAAFLILEKQEEIGNKRVYAELSGYCNATDAFHPSSLSPDAIGPRLAMQGALKSAQLDASSIGFINAHGTATENNDLIESKAMLQVFTNPPPFASSKSNIGHTLGAAGAIEAVYSILNLYHQEIYPSLNCSSPIVETGIIPVSNYRKSDLKHVLSNSFGFGGNCTSLVFSKF